MTPGPGNTMPRSWDREATIAAIRGVARPDSSGVLYVRRSVAERIIAAAGGLSGRNFKAAAHWHDKIPGAKRLACPKKFVRPIRGRGCLPGACPRPYMVVWPLEGLIARIRAFTFKHPWTAKDDDVLMEWYGRKPNAQIAALIFLPPDAAAAIQKRAAKLGLSAKENDGLLTQTAVAKLLGCSSTTVHRWCRRPRFGLRSRRSHAVGKPFIKIDPADLLAFLHRDALASGYLARSRPGVNEKLRHLANPCRYLKSDVKIRGAA